MSHASLDRSLSKYERIPMKTGDRLVSTGISDFNVKNWRSLSTP
ncbi:hypothetical protein [Baaleninema simplex]|nr:hypothetical protein [Baaleninema simplex]